MQRIPSTGLHYVNIGGRKEIEKKNDLTTKDIDIHINHDVGMCYLRVSVWRLHGRGHVCLTAGLTFWPSFVLWQHAIYDSPAGINVLIICPLLGAEGEEIRQPLISVMLMCIFCLPVWVSCSLLLDFSILSVCMTSDCMSGTLHLFFFFFFVLTN